MIDTPADDLANELAPALQAAFEANRDQIIAAAGGPFARWWAAFLFPVFVGFIPVLASVSLDFVAIKFGALTINDLMAWIVNRKAQIAARGT